MPPIIFFTGVGAGGITESSQPFLNGTNNSGRSGFIVPGQGSPLSGQDRTTPAVETGSLLRAPFGVGFVMPVEPFLTPDAWRWANPLPERRPEGGR